jgi:uncharacterized membrane protein
MKSFVLRNKYNILILGLFLGALLIRLYHLDFLPLWRDETFSVNVASKDINGLVDTAIRDTQPPLHLFLLHYWMKIFTNSEFSVRFLSLIFGMIAVLFVYLIAKNYFKSKKYIALTLCFAAISPVFVYYSQEARAYSMLMAFSAALFYFGLQIFNDKKNLLNWLGFILAATFGLYTHNIFGVVLVGYALWAAIKILKSEKLKFFKSEIFLKFVLSFILIALLYIPWLFVFLEQYSKVENDGFWLVFFPIANILHSHFAFLLGPTLSYVDQLTHSLYVAYIGLFGSILFIMGVTFEVKKDKLPKFSFLFFAMLALVLAISFKTPFYYIRYITFVMPLFIILITLGAQNLELSVSKIIWRILIGLFIFFNILFYTVYVAGDIDSKEDSKSAIEYIEENYNESTDIVLNPHAATFHDWEYYARIQGFVYDPNRDLLYYEGLANIDEEDYYDGTLKNFERIWVLNQWDDEGFENELKAFGFEKRERKEFHGEMEVDLWSR